LVHLLRHLQHRRTPRRPGRPRPAPPTHAGGPLTWLAIPQDSPYGIHNLPYGVFSANDQPGRGRIGVRIGDHVLDAGAAARAVGAPSVLLDADTLNPLMAAGHRTWREVRGAVTEWLGDEAHRPAVAPCLLPLAEVELH